MLPAGFKPMLSGKWEPGAIRFPVYVSPKLDGIRAISYNGVVWSRNLKPIPNIHVQRLWGRNTKLCHGMDGELIVGPPNSPNAFNVSTSGVMSEHGEPDVTFHVFDHVEEPNQPFTHRLGRARTFIDATQPPRIKLVTQTLVQNEEELRREEEAYVAHGFEGIMLRAPHGLYKYGRSTVNQGWLIKLKRFEDDEATVMGFEEKMHNANDAKINALGHMERSSHKANQVPMGVLGALIVASPRFGTFNIGSGFNDADRDFIWRNRERLLGATVRFKYQPHGVLDKPRFPVYQGFRHTGDL